MIELVGQVEALVNKEMVEADAKSRNRMAVERDHAEPKSNRHEEAGEMVEMETRTVAPAGRGQRAFDSKPHDQNGREPAKHIVSHALEHARMLCHELREKR